MPKNWIDQSNFINKVIDECHAITTRQQKVKMVFYMFGIGQYGSLDEFSSTFDILF